MENSVINEPYTDSLKESVTTCDNNSTKDQKEEKSTSDLIEEEVKSESEKSVKGKQIDISELLKQFGTLFNSESNTENQEYDSDSEEYDEGDYEEDESSDEEDDASLDDYQNDNSPKRRSMEKLLESHLIITKAFFELL